jgi:homoserine kinase
MHPAASAPQDIVVPGSVSNLGPGFDALSVAVGVYLRVRVLERTPPGEGHPLQFQFVGPAPTGENRIVTAFDLACQRYGRPRSGLRVEASTDIPMRAGLGSSAAATVAGLRLYERLTSPRRTEDWLALASEVEGHPDNAAAALLGGLSLSCQYEDGRVNAWSWPWPPALSIIVATPDAELETAFARKVLPAEIDRRDAVFNLQRALLLLRVLETGEYTLLREALRDRWHQPVRQQFVPGLADALALDHPAVLGVCLSGSGPSVAVFATRQLPEVAAALRGVYDRLRLACTIRTLSAHQPASAAPESGSLP